MESPIDERYRLLLLEHYLDDAKEVLSCGVIRKWVFVCPFCGPLGSTASKKKHRKAALLWNAPQHSWVFSCAKKGSVVCTIGKSFGNFISALNPALGEAYKRDRWHSGTTGKGHNCGAHRGVVGISTSSYGISRSRRFP
jgi:hypothetical protein